MDQLLTVLVQTSPIPSHPSTALLEALFRSFQRADGLLESTIVVVCDGCEETSAGEKENHKHGRASGETASNYVQHLRLLREAVDGKRPPFAPRANGSIRLMPLQERHGSARAIQAALASISTPLVMVCQHDNFFVRDVSFRACVRQLHRSPGLGIGLKCLHFLSTATVDYQQKVQKRYDIGLQEIEVDWLSDSAKLVPLVFWYGRTHLSYTDHYRSTILNRPLQTGDHLEELLGVAQLKDIQRRGMETAFPDYGTYVLDQGIGQVIYHLSGRRARAATEKQQQPVAAVDDTNSTTRASCPSISPTTDGSFTTARSCRAIVPGLEIVSESQSRNSHPCGRFKQRCFHCGQKGHSYKWCPKMTDTPTTDTIDLS